MEQAAFTNGLLFEQIPSRPLQASMTIFERLADCTMQGKGTFFSLIATSELMVECRLVHSFLLRSILKDYTSCHAWVQHPCFVHLLPCGSGDEVLSTDPLFVFVLIKVRSHKNTTSYPPRGLATCYMGLSFWLTPEILPIYTMLRS